MPATEGVFITQNTRKKIDKAAYAMALMERGLYEWPDGKQRYRMVEGMREYRAVQSEAMRYAWGSVGSATYTLVFNNEDSLHHQFYEERLSYHRRRLEGGYTEALAELTDGGDALKKLSVALYDSLMDELSDPERSKEISFRDRATLYRDVTKLEAGLKGDAATKGGQPAGSLHIEAGTVIGNLSLPATVRDRVEAALQDIVDAEAEEEVPLGEIRPAPDCPSE